MQTVIGALYTQSSDDELENKTLKLKRMSDGEQFEAGLDNIEVLKMF